MRASAPGLLTARARLGARTQSKKASTGACMQSKKAKSTTAVTRSGLRMPDGVVPQLAQALCIDRPIEETWGLRRFMVEFLLVAAMGDAQVLHPALAWHMIPSNPRCVMPLPTDFPRWDTFLWRRLCILHSSVEAWMGDAN